MNKKTYWSVGVGLVGVYLATAQTYWLPGTLFWDLRALSLGAAGGALIGFVLGCIVEEVTNERKRRLKISYWIFIAVFFGYFLGAGKMVAFSTRVSVMEWALGIGAVIALLQYFLQRPKNISR